MTATTADRGSTAGGGTPGGTAGDGTAGDGTAGDGTAAGGGTAAGPGGIQARWLALVFIALAQLMIALDATIMNIALPTAQADLRFSDADRQWVITAYTLAFGGLLLLGGRVADRAGRRRAFLAGLAGFAAASAAGGAATGLPTLIAARAAQGAFAALLAPTALSLLAVTFTQPRERARAFAVFGAIAGGGGALGLLLGGVLTQDLSWRWCLYVNVAVAAVAAVGGAALLPAAGRSGGPARLDLPGALLAGGGLVAIVYAASRTATLGWASPVVLGLLAAGLGLLAVFVWWQSRAPAPLLPLHILAERNRAGAALTVALTVAGLLGLFLFLTYYLQVVLGYQPVTAGLAVLPLSAAVLVSSQAVAAPLLPRVPPRALVVPGLLLGAVAMLLLTRLTPDGGYAGRVLPAEILLGLGLGVVFVPAINTGTQRVGPRDAGVAAAVVNTAQQVGGSIGVAVLNTVAAGATVGYLAAHPRQHIEALVHGYGTAAWVAAAVFAVAAVLAAVLLDAPSPQQTPSTTDTVHS